MDVVAGAGRCQTPPLGGVSAHRPVRACRLAKSLRGVCDTAVERLAGSPHRSPLTKLVSDTGGMG